MILCPIEPSHRLLFNKYSVYRPSLLLITKHFAPQTDGLDVTDLAAAWAVLNHFEERYMLIYNCGFNSGSSQGHKHMQLWPYPEPRDLGFDLFPSYAKSNSVTDNVAGVPHQHFVVRLPPGADAATLAHSYDQLLAAMRESIDATYGKVDYNVILVKDWMCMIPRRLSGLERGAGANAAAAMGLVWITREAARDVWTSVGPNEYLSPGTNGEDAAQVATLGKLWEKVLTNSTYGCTAASLVSVTADHGQITHSEWASSDAYSASAGAGVRGDKQSHAAFKRLPFNFCALSLQPFSTPVCTEEGVIFDHENIIRWLLKHETNPTTGKPLKHDDLIKLNFAKNDGDEYVDPVTFKVFTDNTHLVAIRHGDEANAFAFETIERLNIKAKMWRDLVSDQEFARKDVITLQDPQNLESRNLSAFKYLADGEDAGVPKEEASINSASLGSAADLKIIKAKEAVARARTERANVQVTQPREKPTSAHAAAGKTAMAPSKPTPYNATRHTTGLAAASFTSTGVTPHTSATLALMTDEEYLLKRGRVKEKGYARLSTSEGDLHIELYPEYAPKAVWNFVRLAQKDYYNSIVFHRNIRNFMIQTGDPTGTGKGGTSIWGKNFEDEIEGPLKHDKRGVISMANKGKNTNSSQFFITYRPTPHLNRKHTIFGRVVDDDETSLAVLKKLEAIPVDAQDRPTKDTEILAVTIVIDPFEEFWKKKRDAEQVEKAKEGRQHANDEHTTWTGKRIRADGTVQANGVGGVGKYLKTHAQLPPPDQDEEIVEVLDEPDEPIRKKAKGKGGFGNFDGW